MYMLHIPCIILNILKASSKCFGFILNVNRSLRSLRLSIRKPD